MISLTVTFGTLWPLILYGILVLAAVCGLLAVSFILGQRHKWRASEEIYESGIVSTGSSAVRFDAKFYLMAMFFVIFDLEAVFIFAYAVSFRELGWTGYVEILIFIMILIAALVYLWRLGALDWRTIRHRTRTPAKP